MKKDINKLINKLMNKIIKLWWVPWWIYTSLIVGMELVRCEEYTWSSRNRWCSYRELVSKESWLRQFCVKNDFIDYSKVRAYWISFAPLEIQSAGEMQNYDNIHRLLWDCASLDEDMLADFILNVIKIH